MHENELMLNKQYDVFLNKEIFINGLNNVQIEEIQSKYFDELQNDYKKLKDDLKYNDSFEILTKYKELQKEKEKLSNEIDKSSRELH